ncbi:VWA domain-containing protein [Ferrimonas sp. SCSIO 43195]|uniref:vWA domain-containing protein n=1 Tax=Ferrimonas sp. SCSIO 43195 TaxID=2822844 RepID=UPI0020754F23|nr:VWA domain-containing protein [Ferrimonas sp. SCSIO 43195]USD36682.1 VWA domain-containing protein [Ferrimonas sp. SCSIO 43195]
MLTLAWPYLLLAVVTPWLLPRPRQRQGAVTALKLPWGQSPLHSSERRPTPAWMKAIMLCAWLALIIACARPQWLGEPVPLERQGRDLMIAADLSGSMQIQDMRYQDNMIDRFSMMQHLLGDFVRRREGDRIGLILFADGAYLQAPLTFDRYTVKRYLDEAVLGLVGQQTAIGDAIALAVKRFSQLQDSNKVLLLLTDGSNNAGQFNVDQALQLAKNAGVKIYAIGIGADSLKQTSWMGFDTRQVNPSRDLNEAVLQQLANETGGQYFRARSGDSMQQIYTRLDQLEPVARDEKRWRPKTELYAWPLGLALLLTALGLVAGRRTQHD